MSKRLGPIRVTGSSGVLLLGLFLLGLSSGPIRPCFNHPDHAGSGAGASHAGMPAGSGHHAAMSGSPDETQSGPASHDEGCDCLGLCHGEQSPVMPAAAQVASLPQPSQVHAAVLSGTERPTTGLDFRTPPARAPPIIA